VSFTAQWIERTSGSGCSASTKPSSSNSPSGHEHDERLARVAALAHHEVTEIALLGLLIVGLQARLVGPGLDRLPDRVPEVGREPALADVEHLVPAAGAVEAERDLPVFLREGVLELVAVVEDRLRRDHRLKLEALQTADAGEGVGDLRVLGRDLRLVGEVLEAAAPAGRVVLAGRLHAGRTRLDDLEGDRLGVVSLHLRDLRAHRVAREPAADEDDEAVQARDAVPAVGERVDREVELLVLLDGGCSHPASLAAVSRES
jgi:hypothetical protein